MIDCLQIFRERRSIIGMLAVLVGLVPLAAATVFAEGLQDSVERGFVLLLDGDSQSGWIGYANKSWPKGWVIDGGTLHRKAGGGDIMTTKKYADFDFRFEFKISPGGNSGVIYRASTGDKHAYETGPEFQVLDNKQHRRGKNLLTSTASLYGLYAPAKDVSKPAGQWNRGRILLRGNHVEHWLNGVKVVECELGSEDWKRRVANSKFSKWKRFATNRSGHIALQDHGDEVWYRNLRIRTLGGSTGSGKR